VDVRIRIALSAALMAGALVAMAEARPRVETIRYATSGCFGTCPVYAVTVSADGRGTFEGQRFTAVTGERRFRVTPAQWRAFRGRLEPLRGRVDAEGQETCQPVVTDMPGATVRWSGGFPTAKIAVNYGCDRHHYGWMFDRLRSAPGTLPIAAFIGDGRRPR
jgi:hypothetical protein